MNEQQKRRQRERTRRENEIRAEHRSQLDAAEIIRKNDVREASERARKEGFDAGAKFQKGVMLTSTLFHAGQLFGEGKDNDAKAVREMHRLLANDGKPDGAGAETEKKAA